MDPVAVWTRIYTILPIDSAAIIDLHYSHGETLAKIAARFHRPRVEIIKQLNESIEVLRKDKELWLEFRKAEQRG